VKGLLTADTSLRSRYGQSWESAAGVKGGFAGEQSERTLDAREHSLTMISRLRAAATLAGVSRAAGSVPSP
jgi:hypothetical protein